MGTHAVAIKGCLSLGLAIVLVSLPVMAQDDQTGAENMPAAQSSPDAVRQQDQSDIPPITTGVLIDVPGSRSALEWQVAGEPLVRFRNVRVERRSDGRGWQVRGRITRFDPDIKVPPGQLEFDLYAADGTQVHSGAGNFYSRHIHRYKKRASRFTLRFPEGIKPSLHRVEVRYRPRPAQPSSVQSSEVNSGN